MQGLFIIQHSYIRSSAITLTLRERGLWIGLFPENESNCLKCQDTTMLGFHRSPVLIMLLSMISSLRIHAVRATFFGLPA